MSPTPPHRKLFVLAIGGRRRASSRLRIWDHVDWLRQEGFSVVADHEVPDHASRVARLGRLIGRMPFWIYHAMTADFVFIQESLALAPVIGLVWRIRRPRIVFDFSDPVDFGHHGWRGLARRWAFRRIIAAADAIAVENPIYKTLLGSCAGRVAQFYGPVDSARYGAHREIVRPVATARDDVLIGWTGSPSTLAFIAFLFPILDEMATTRRIRLMLIGVNSVEYAFKNISLSLHEWNEKTEFALVPTFDLGLFAIADGAFAARRGGGKLFIYLAAGVPFLATDRGIASYVLKETGIGFGVAAPEDWKSRLIEAVDEVALRREYSERGLAFANAHLSYGVYRTEHLQPLITGKSHDLNQSVLG